MNTLAQGQKVNEIDLVTLVETGSFDPDEKIVFCTSGIEDSNDQFTAIVLDRQNTPVVTFTAQKAVGNIDSNLYLSN